MRSTRDIKYNLLVVEGGMGGHMKHPFDYSDFTANDLLELIDDLFDGKVENMKEKLDGTNIQATLGSDKKIAFIRNNGDLNSERGGMSLQDMKDKWKDNPHVAENFVRAGEIIEEVFKNIDYKFFRPDENTRVYVNCECISAGQTNIMPYITDRVAFHGIDIYKKNEETGKYERVESREGMPAEISKAIVGIKHTEPRPSLIINSVEKSQEYKQKFEKEIREIWNDEGLSFSTDINTWKKKRFEERIPDWMKEDKDVFFNRYFNDDKSVNLGVLKKKYPEHIDEIVDFDKKGYKVIISEVMGPIDDLFMSLGTALISILDGFTNTGNESKVIDKLNKDLQSVVDEINKNGSDEAQEKLERQLQRLQKAGQINAAEGVVFTYKGRLMKCTGSFSALNQILGLIKFNR